MAGRDDGTPDQATRRKGGCLVLKTATGTGEVQVLRITVVKSAMISRTPLGLYAFVVASAAEVV